MNEPREEKIGERTFRLATLDAMSQVHCLRRMGPAVVGAIPALLAWLDTTEQTPEEKKAEVLAQMIAAIPSVAAAFARMTDEDVEYVINKCLSCAHVQQGMTFARVRNGNVTMFADLDMSTMMQISYLVLKESLGGFFPTELPKGSAAVAQTPGSPTSETAPIS